MGTALQKQSREGEGHDHCGYHRPPLSTSASSTAVANVAELMAQWQAWLRTAEALFVNGRFKACNEALRDDPPPHPTGPMAAGLLTAIAKTNAAICRHAEVSMVMRGGGCGVGWGDSRSDSAVDNADAEAWEASIAALENALREVVKIGIKAASSAGIVLPPQPPRSAPLPSAKSGARAKHVVGGGGGVVDGVKVAAGSMPPSVNTRGSGKSGASGGRAAGVRGGGRGKGERKGESGLSAVVIAAAAEDVAVQAACAVLTARLAWGEPSKALSTGLRLLASRRTTVAATTAAAGTASNGGANDRGILPGLAEQDHLVSKYTEEGSAMDVDGEQGAGKEDRRKREEREEESARDVFAGVDALRDAFGSALDGAPGARGRRLPLAEAAPRLLHLLRLSWLLAASNLALGRPGAAARVLAVAEHAYGARRSAWRKAALMLATSSPGASSATPPAAGPSASFLGSRAASTAAVSTGEYGVGYRGGGGGGGRGVGRDPALAMCRFLRGVGLLAGGDSRAAAEQMEESLDLDPRGRNAVVCLAHLFCFASANANANANEIPRASTRLQWNALDDRTQEVLRVVALGVSSGNDDVLREGVGRVGEGREFDVKRGAFGDEESGGGGGVEARILLACVARARGDDGEAVSMFRKALALDPNCLEAVYGIARVVQESGEHDASRELLLYLGERSQEEVSSVTATTDGSHAGNRRSVDNDKSNKASAGIGRDGGTAADGDSVSTGYEENARPSGGGGGGSSSTGRGGDGGGGGGVAGAGAGSSSALALSAGGTGLRRSRRGARLHFLLGGGSGGSPGGVVRSPVLPAALPEVMWRVARASMGARDWATAILALEGLVAEGGRTSRYGSPQPVYFAASAKGVAPRAPPGPGRARVLRALAYCQLQKGLYRDAMKTSQAVLGERVGGGEGGDARAGKDAAMLMLRADALLCLEEGEATALASLEHAAELFNLRQIDMSAFPPPPPTERSLSSPISRAAEVEDAAAHTEDAKQASHSRSKRSKTSAADDNTAAAGGGAAAVGPTLRDSAAFVSAAQPVAAVGIHAPRALSSDASRDDRDRRVARVAAFNNRAVLLIAAGRGTEACRLLRSCLLILPGEPRPAFNLALALWRLGRPRLACSHWLEARGWGGELGRGGDLEMLSRLLESARRRKVLLKSNAENMLAEGSGSDGGASRSHVIEGRGDALSVPQSQLCLLDIRTLAWWLDNVDGESETPAASGKHAAATAPGGLRSLLKL